jgi:cytochrome bd-type quinol oxidase subunit 2
MVIPVPRAGFIEKFLGARGWNQKGGAAVSLVSALTTVWCLTMARSTVPQLSQPHRLRAAAQRSGEALGSSVMLWLIVVGLAVVAFYAF